MRCGVGHRFGSNLALLGLWHKPAAVAPIGPLAWEPPYALSGIHFVLIEDQKVNKCLLYWILEDQSQMTVRQ